MNSSRVAWPEVQRLGNLFLRFVATHGGHHAEAKDTHMLNLLTQAMSI